ncbi:tRNA-uridine aminocarboxypropyltransferase [Thaumasiovibrio subtropicus]|uniref:tRNA-uridine aminocarboxypropyltransferase n=1 Tax=Thaumasiovibrio subtropicus TaxID=1891207 RepID=UPI000B34EDEF|nr:tRNA-uridine aminocarboxypropyltransferase [Thaumasiovibrio subtropicus]
MRIHAIHRLHKARLARATKPFNARGGSVDRCEFCMVNRHLCICEHKPSLTSQAAFLLIMFDDEVLKPSNTGRLIADLFEDSFAYIWHRTEPDCDMLAVLRDPQWQPYLIFPSEYAPEREVTNIHVQHGKRPLFVLLDGSWKEAKKMFHKSPYLADLPLLSISPQEMSRFRLREASKKNQLATAEVAAKIVARYGETHNAQLLDLWFDVFREHYETGKKQRQLPVPGALERLKSAQ